MAAAAAALAGAIIVGVLIGFLFSVLFSGVEPTAQYRAGGHAWATVLTSTRAAAASAVAVVEGADGVATSATRTRSPARGGFAVGRTEGAAAPSSVIITTPLDTRSPARGGFAVGRGD